MFFDQTIITNLITCPISLQIFNEPVTLSDGNTYEKTEIIKFLKNNKISPLTGSPVSDNINKLKVNILIKNLIDDFLLNNTIKQSDIYEVKTCIKEKYLLKNINNEIMVKNWIDNIDNYVFCGKKGMNLIHYICKYSTPSLVKYAIDKSICSDYDEINLVEAEGSTLKNLAFLEAETINNWRPIHYICRYGTPEVIKYIIDKDVNLVGTEGSTLKSLAFLETETNNGWRPIHLICRHSTFEVIKYIIEKGVNLEAKTNKGWRPIHFICRYGTLKIIKYFINKCVSLKVKLKVKTNKNSTPLKFLFQNENKKIKKILMQNKITDLISLLP